MALRYDICLACIPFTIGTVLACLLPETMVTGAACICGLCTGILTLDYIRSDNKWKMLAALVTAGMFCLCTSRMAVSPENGKGGTAMKMMDGICRIIDSLDFRQPETLSLMKALVTGRREGLSDQTQEAFRKSGTSHILALSGMHLGILYGILSALLSWTGGTRISRTVRSILAVSACTLYCLMAGSSPSLVRAVLFVLINEAARMMPGRKSGGAYVFCIALTIQLAFTPESVESVGFQLSYLSVLAIITIYPKMKAMYPQEGNPVMKRIWSAASLSISCQLFTAPAVLWHFGTFPPYFLIGNLIGVPLCTALMCLSIACISLSALGQCPDILLRLTENVGQALISCMETVSRLT